MRPDTPEPAADPFFIEEMDDEMLETAFRDSLDADAISVEEMNARLLETARQESLRERMEAIAAEDLEIEADIERNEVRRTPTSRPRSPFPPPVRYNEHGQLAAGSKGKGRAN
jgi:hypothetical protein